MNNTCGFISALSNIQRYYFHLGKNEKKAFSDEDLQNKLIREFFQFCLFGLGFPKSALLEEILSPRFALRGCFSR